MRNRMVLVVEDNESWQDFYWNFFEVVCKGQFEWHLATSAERALDVLERNRAAKVSGYRFDYALTPLGELGNAQRVSLNARW